MKASILALTLVLSSLVGCGGQKVTTNNPYAEKGDYIEEMLTINESDYYSVGSALPSHVYVENDSELTLCKAEYNLRSKVMIDCGVFGLFGSYEVINGFYFIAIESRYIGV